MIRASIVLAFLLSGAGIIGLVALFPAYIRAYLAENAVVDTVVSLKNDASSARASAAQAQLAADAALIGKASALPRSQASAFIESIVDVRQKIRLTSITVDQSNPRVISATVQGIAPTRDSIEPFKARLEAALPGSTVTYPYSQLAKSVDVEFSFKVVQTSR